MKFGGQMGVDLQTIVDWMVVEGKITYDYIKTFLEHAKSVVEVALCKAHDVIDAICAATSSFVCWVLTQAGTHYFCNADNLEQNLTQAAEMIWDIVSDFWEETKKYWNTRQDAYDRFLQPLKDRALSHWKGGAIAIGGAGTLLVFDISCEYTIGIDRYHNMGFYQGCGYAWQGIVEASFGMPTFKILPELENVQDLGGHGLSYGASIVIGEGNMLDIDFNLEFGCGSWAAADVMSGLTSAALSGKCVLHALGWVDEPLCECNQYAMTPEKQNARWPPQKDLVCKYIGPSIKFSIKRGFHIGNLPLNMPWIDIPRFASQLALSASFTKGYAFNKGVEWWDGDHVVPTQSNKICSGHHVGRFWLGRRWKQDCINACKRIPDCVAAEFHHRDRRCFGVKTCPELKWSSNTVMYQSFNMAAKAKEVFEKKCFDDFSNMHKHTDDTKTITWNKWKCGNVYCPNDKPLCRNNRCMSWDDLTASELEVGSGSESLIQETLASNSSLVFLFALFGGCVLLYAYLKQRKSKLDESYGLLAGLQEEI